MASTERREYAGGAKPTTITTDITAGSTSITLTDPTGWPTGGTGPFFAVLERTHAAEEKIKCTSRSGNTLTVASRGVDGTAAAAHVAGVAIEHGGVADDFDLFNQHTSGDQSDPHPEYNLESLVDAKGDLIVASADNTPTRLAVGTNDQVLTAASGEATGLKWAAIPTPSTTAVGVRVFRSAAQTANPDATVTVVAFTAETFDTSVFHDNATNNSRLTIPAGLGGMYAITGAVSFASNATGYRYAQLLVNGTDVKFGQITAAVTGQSTVSNVADLRQLVAGDYVEIGGFHNSGGALDFDGGTKFTFLAMHRIGS